ncbi:MAG TPA: type II toxin-antitoxin system PrlF family antitoxin [Rhizomicrobium sp.]|jgi:antitoxin PrlF
MPTAVIRETSTITAKGQTTVPKSVRRALGVDCGGKIVFRVEGARITVSSAETAHRDPALGAYLALIAGNLAHGRNVRELPPGLARAMRNLASQVPVSLEEKLDGDVAL